MGVTTTRVLDEGVWQVDRSRSTVGFRVRHFGVAMVAGRFESFAGHLESRDGELHVEGHVRLASVVTGNRIRDARLRSEFFDAERYPVSSLRARGVERGGLGGELTIRGVTRPIELRLTVDPEGDDRARVRLEGNIRRSDFGLDWDALREAGRLLVGDEVGLHADGVLTRAAYPVRARRALRGRAIASLAGSAPTGPRADARTRPATRGR